MTDGPNELDQDFICELCLLPITKLEAHVRIGVDSVCRDDKDKYYSLIENRVIVMATFHNDCVRDTANRKEYDEVVYIEEARALLSVIGLDSDAFKRECAFESSAEAPVVKLKCIQGGLVT